jgi:hypothetical protein
VFGCISVVLVEGACVRDYKSLALCKVGIVHWSVGDECVRGRDSLVTGWGRRGGADDGWRKRVGERGRTRFWGGEQWILAQEKEGE